MRKYTSQQRSAGEFRIFAEKKISQIILNSADPTEQPTIDFNPLAMDEDVMALVNALRYNFYYTYCCGNWLQISLGC